MEARLDLHEAWSLHGEEGKGVAGCLIFLLVLAVAAFIGIRIWPDYYAFKSLETDVKTEVSRAGANFFDDETLAKNVLMLAKRNEVRVTRENIKIERFAGQIFLTVQYIMPMDLGFYKWKKEFEIKASSFIGRL
jgi:hypothetical protein